MPSVADELERGFAAIGELELARIVESMEIFGRCACGDRDCGTFHTRPGAEWTGKRLRQMFPPVRRLIAVDVHDHRVVCVEFLGRRDVVAALDAHLGITRTTTR